MHESHSWSRFTYWSNFASFPFRGLLLLLLLLLSRNAVLRSRTDSLRSCRRWLWMSDSNLSWRLFEYPPKWCTYSAVGCYMAGTISNCCRLGAFCVYHTSHHVTSLHAKPHTWPAVTSHLRFCQNDVNITLPSFHCSSWQFQTISIDFHVFYNEIISNLLSRWKKINN